MPGVVVVAPGYAGPERRVEERVENVSEIVVRCTDPVVAERLVRVISAAQNPPQGAAKVVAKVFDHKVIAALTVASLLALAGCVAALASRIPTQAEKGRIPSEIAVKEFSEHVGEDRAVHEQSRIFEDAVNRRLDKFETQLAVDREWWKEELRTMHRQILDLQNRSARPTALTVPAAAEARR